MRGRIIGRFPRRGWCNGPAFATVPLNWWFARFVYNIHMSASKKSKKSSNSPARATKSAASKDVAKKTTVATVQAATPTPVAMLAPAPAPVAPVASVAVKPVVSTPVKTTISARIDVGFGNALFLRGEGPGLSWEKGLAMECVENDLWRIVLAESARAYTFKFLINDTTWSAGPDFTAACCTSVTLTPEF